MNQAEWIQTVLDTAKNLYQNKEQEGLQQTQRLMEELQKMVLNQPEAQLERTGNFSIAMLRELTEAYQNSDVIAAADCLTEKVTLFLRFYFQENK